jgi:hypothetical protein
LGRSEKSIVIKASPEKVWEMLALDRWSEWQVGPFIDTKNIKFTSEVSTPEDKYRVGASAYPSAHPEADFEVTESLKNEKITYLHGGDPLTYILEPVEDGTKLTYTVEYEMPWGIFGKFIEKTFGKRLGERGVEKSLENLKSILEK